MTTNTIKADDLHAENMANDPAYREAYEQLEGEFSMIHALLEARTRANLTLAEVASRMGTTESAISRLERTCEAVDANPRTLCPGYRSPAANPPGTHSGQVSMDTDFKSGAETSSVDDLPNNAVLDNQEPRNLPMALSMKDRETKQLARRLAERTGESITAANRRALEERLKRTGSDGHKAALLEDLEAIRRRVAALPILDDRSSDEIIGYDENGIPS